jgi:oligopeptide/dipeptide ABC transporter ATP-binding protein
VTTAEPILRIEQLRKYFPVRNVWRWRVGWLRAVDDVSLEVARGETLGIVGESGCGKSTLGKTLMCIHPTSGGRVIYQGQDIAGLKPHQSRQYREHVQYCYQDPGASLDPRWTIRSSLHEPLIVHTGLGREEREARVREILHAVGLPETHLDLYPHEISGGQQRRVGLARILTLKPSVVILDEPTSGLDVSVQATILNLFLELQRQFGLTYLFISHDLSVVRLICDRVAVMYLGRIVEIGETRAVFETPRHPYTRSLLAAIPSIGGPRVTDTFSLEGEPPSPANLPSGCRFRTRCPWAQPLCAEQDPALRPDWPTQSAACHFAE